MITAPKGIVSPASRPAAALALALCLAAAAPRAQQAGPEADAAPSFSASVLPEPDLSFDPGDRRERTLVFTALAGAESQPAYFGASDTDIRPELQFDVLFLNFDALRFGERAGLPADPNARRRGLGIGGSFRFVRPREAGDHDDLAGLDDIDRALEFGLQVGAGSRRAEAFAGLRYGVTGHEGLVGEIGANLVARPTERIALRAGPRLLYGDETYADTYFGVSDAEAAASDFDAYEPGAGLMRAGIEVVATYRLADRWWLEGRARFDRLQDGAADSPITRAGSEDQSSVTIGVRRAFVLDF